MTNDESPHTYSAFWPVAILLGAFALSYTFQLVELISQRSYINGQYVQLAPNITKAQDAHNRLVALLNDLIKAAHTDQNAAAIVRAAQQAGIVREQAPTSGATTNAPTTSR